MGEGKRMATKEGVIWGWCDFCDPFGEFTVAYLSRNAPTVRYYETYKVCLSCKCTTPIEDRGDF
jgi:hypothetical protein